MENEDWIQGLVEMPWILNKKEKKWKVCIFTKEGLSMWFHCFNCSFEAIKRRLK